jgi:hypothetical protein
MHNGLVAALVGIALMAPLSSARAQQVDAQGCTASPTNIPPELAAWPSRRPIIASAHASGLRAARLAIGSAADATLRPTSDVRYPVRPEKPGGSASYGGLFTFTVDRPGTYRIALGSAAWIDVLRDKKIIASTAHGHGPDCSGIRKMVDFPLAPGRYTLQVAAAGEPTVALMIARLP